MGVAIQMEIGKFLFYSFKTTNNAFFVKVLTCGNLSIGTAHEI